MIVDAALAYATTQPRTPARQILHENRREGHERDARSARVNHCLSSM